jgi:hypothetical protein
LSVPTSSLDALGTTAFDFTILADGVAKPPVTGLTAGTCSLPLFPFPLLRADGTPTIVTITEDGSSAASWTVSSATCAGCRSPIAKVNDVDGTLPG